MSAPHRIGKWNPELQCNLLETHVRIEDSTVFMRLAHGSCVDMDGAISLAKRLHHGVLTVMTFQCGAETGGPDIADTAYHRKTSDDPWVCFPHMTMRERLSAEAITDVMRLWSAPSNPMPNGLKLWDAADLIGAPIDRKGWIVGMLRSAANILETNLDGGRNGSVSWRVADAGLELRRIIEDSGQTHVPGIHEPTGMGAMLPKKVAT